MPLVRKRKQQSLKRRRDDKERDHSDNDKDDFFVGALDGSDNDNDNDNSPDAADASANPLLEAAHAETPQQKRLRLAKEYLARTAAAQADIAPGDIDAAEVDRQLLEDRVRRDLRETSGKHYRRIAAQFKNITVPEQHIRTLKGHQKSITAIAITTASSNPLLYSAAKESTFIKWDLATGRRLHAFEGGLKKTHKIKKLLKAHGVKKADYVALGWDKRHADEVLAVAASADGKIVATGSRDKRICLWSTSDDAFLGKFEQHRDAVTGLAFRRSTHSKAIDTPATTATSTANELYSVSLDRTVKLWNADDQTYVETLFGHQDNISAVDTLQRERCVTVGTRDRTARLWKISEETQLVFRASDCVGGTSAAARELGGSVDTVCLVDEDTFVTGSDAGALSLWSTRRKKPLFTRLNAHGPKATTNINSNSAEAPSSSQPHMKAPEASNWISALAALPYTDLFASGACDGSIRLWMLNADKTNFTQLAALPAVGFVNALAFAELKRDDGGNDDDPSGIVLAAGLGQEHRLGRWFRCKKAKNVVKVLSLGKSVAAGNAQQQQ